MPTRPLPPTLDGTGRLDTPQTRVERRIRSELLLDTAVTFVDVDVGPNRDQHAVLCTARATGRTATLRSHDEAEIQRVIRELRG